MASRRSPSSGFTLLEVMIALLILGASLGAIFGGLYQAKRISWRADERLAATRILHNLLVDEQLRRQCIAEGEINDEVKDEDGWGYRFSSEELVIDVGDEESLELPGIFKIIVCVRHTASGRERKYCLERWQRK
ncbi:MAG: type II secretion system protein [Pseudomonadota bacterium]|nr:type II secretion system protein [Pseudomonadota bacterium]